MSTHHRVLFKVNKKQRKFGRLTLYAVREVHCDEIRDIFDCCCGGFGGGGVKFQRMRDVLVRGGSFRFM